MILICGPSGTGKELVARAIHEHSPRRDRPLVTVDCAAIAGPLSASHLFGHVEGAFTGAGHSALGCFRAADGGTVFLDEIGELDRDLQAKLLRVLQHRVVVPFGCHQEIPVDLQIIAATNRDLHQAVQEGSFREDLYYRLQVVSLRTVPLKERSEDIPLLARHFLEQFASQNGFPLLELTPGGVKELQKYHWPGNVRQLQNSLERAVLFGHQSPLDEKSAGISSSVFCPKAALDHR